MRTDWRLQRTGRVTEVALFGLAAVHVVLFGSAVVRGAWSPAAVSLVCAVVLLWTGWALAGSRHDREALARRTREQGKRWP